MAKPVEYSSAVTLQILLCFCHSGKKQDWGMDTLTPSTSFSSLAMSQPQNSYRSKIQMSLTSHQSDMVRSTPPSRADEC